MAHESYLKENLSKQSSDLISLLAVLQVVFGEQSPVFSKIPSRNPGNIPGAQSPQPAARMPASVGFLPQPPQQPLGPNATSATPYPSYMPTTPGSGWQMPTMPIMPQMPAYNTTPFVDMTYTPQPIPNAVAAKTGAATTDGIPEDHLLNTVRSAVSDKVRRVRNELLGQYGDELRAIMQAQSEIHCGGQRLQAMLTQMETEKAKAVSTTEWLEKRNTELEDLLKRLGTGENDRLDCDDVVTATSPLYRQLVSSYAEEQAINDTIYYLRGALDRNALELGVFLKKVRELSRKQFMLRATVQRCREKAGLNV